MNLKIERSLLPTLISTIMIVTGSVFAQNPVPERCVPRVAETFGMEGLEIPERIELPMCPMIVASCCKRSDEITIFSNWEMGGEMKALNRRFDGYYEIYSNLINQVVVISDFASELVDRLKDRKISNCKVLAKRVMHFEIKEIAPKLKEMIKGMNEFFFTSYKGVYCATCDAINHNFIKAELETPQIVLSKKFCRDITANSLHFLLYFHVHFVKYLNLLIKFTNYCDAKGRFLEKPISNSDLFFIDRPVRDKLELCKRFRNEDNWFEMCQFICEKFNIINYQNFFEPNLLKFKDTTRLLSELFKSVIGSDAQTGSAPALPHRRLLTDSGTTTKNEEEAKKLEINQSDISETEKVYPIETVIRSAYMGPVMFSEFKSEFEDPGIDLYDYGKGSLITQNIFDTILAEENAKTGEMTGEGEKKPVDIGGGVEDSRLLAHSSILSVTNILATIIMVIGLAS